MDVSREVALGVLWPDLSKMTGLARQSSLPDQLRRPVTTQDAGFRHVESPPGLNLKTDQLGPKCARAVPTKIQLYPTPVKMGRVLEGGSEHPCQERGVPDDDGP